MKFNQLKTLIASASLFAALGLMTPSVFAQAQPVQNPGEITRAISELEDTFIKPAEVASKYRTESRLNDARVAYYLEDYQRASVLFMDLVRRETEAFPSYRESLFLLGDSLYRLRNYQASRRYLKQLIDMGRGTHFDDAARLYLEMAYESRNFEGVDQILSKLQGQGVDGALDYISGKTLYRQGKFEEARQSFMRASSNPEYSVVGLYFAGVAQVAQKEYDAALTTFQTVTAKAPGNPRDISVIELAYIAQGRLAYERGDLESAIDLYNRVPRESEHFDRALWEFTWVLVAKEMYREARRNVEILLLNDPNPAFEPEAKLLKADLSILLNEYELAEDDFKDILTTFEPVKAEMDKLAAEQQDLQAFFSILVEEVPGEEVRQMPPLVTKWLESDDSVAAATAMIRDVRNVSRDIEDTGSVIREINARLSSGARVQSFPELSEGLAQGIEVENQLLATRHAMLEKQVSRANLSGDLATRWQAMASELEAIKAAHERAPQSRVELAEREELIFQEYDRLRSQLDAVAYQIDSQNAQLAAVNTYLEREYGRDLSQSEKERVDALRAEIRGTLKELENLRSQIQSEITESRSMVGVGDDVVRAEGNIRKRYQDALARAESMLGGQGLDASMQNARAEFPQQHQRLDAFFAKLESLVDEKVSEIRSEIEGEERLLAEHRASLQELMFASQGGAGVLAYLNFMRTRAKFDELVLRADVGLIDVKWQKKERISNQINQLFEDRTSELRMLQEAFNEVR